MDLKEFATDRDAEEHGTWVSVGGDTELLIARANNSAYRRLVKKLTRPHRAAIRSDNLPDDVLESIAIEATAQTILLGWRKLTEGGVEVPYSLEAAREYLTRYSDFRDLVAGYASEAATFRRAAQEAEEKN